MPSDRCQRRVRLLGILWSVRCNGELRQRPSSVHPGRVYSCCQRCGDATWPSAADQNAALDRAIEDNLR